MSPGVEQLVHEQLVLEKAELLHFIYLAPIAILRLGPLGEIEMLNPRAVQVLHDLGIETVGSSGAEILDTLSPGLAEVWRSSAGRCGPVVPPRRCSPVHPSGAALHWQVQLERPDRRCTMLVIQDVSVVVEQEREIARQRRRIGLVLEHIHGYCVAMLDIDGAVLEWNPSIGRLLGATEARVVGRSFFDGIDVEASRAPPVSFQGLLASVTRAGWCRLQAPWRQADGRLMWGDCVVTPLVEPSGVTNGYVAVVRDVTDEYLRTQRLIEEALTDPLTGLHNRRGLEHRLASFDAPHVVDAHAGDGTEMVPNAALPRAFGPGSASVLMIDVDHFKRVNDTYGHDAGDAVLQGLAAALQRCAREGDIVARLGGEEFVLLLPGAELSIAATVGERLRGQVEALVLATGVHTIRVTASVGVAERVEGEGWTALLERVDTALYRAKMRGRNRVEVA